MSRFKINPIGEVHSDKGIEFVPVTRSSLFHGSIVMQRYIMFTEMTDFKSYIYDTDENILRMQDRLNKTIEEFSKDVGDTLKEELTEEQFEEEIVRYKHFYPETFYNSSLIWAYSFLENFLKEAAESIERQGVFKIKISDFGRIGIDRYEKYLRLVANINSKKLDSIWPKIQHYESHRNLVVHNSSLIIKNNYKPLDKQPLYILFKKNRNLEITDVGILKIKNKNYLIKFAEIIQEYFEELYRQIIIKLELFVK